MSWSYIFIILTLLFWGVTPSLDKVALTGKGASPLSGLVVRSTAIMFAILIFSLFRRDMLSNAFSLPLKNIVFFALSGICAGLFGVLTYYTALKQLPSSVVVPLCSIYPLIAAILGVLILKENFNLYKFVGVIFIVIGVWLVK